LKINDNMDMNKNSNEDFVQISVRIPKKLLIGIDFLAVDQVRNRNNMIEFILTDWMKENGKDQIDLEEDDKYMAILDAAEKPEYAEGINPTTPATKMKNGKK